MKVCVVGLWHLGSVTSACLASGGHDVVGLDFDESLIKRLQAGEPPIYEPGLEDLIAEGLNKNTLRFTGDLETALDGVDVVWVAYDTPVDEEDHADVQYVVDQVEALFPFLPMNAIVMVSSQLPVGTTALIEQNYVQAYPKRPVTFACSPENLRLGNAISVFSNPDRVVVGLRSDAAKEKVTALLKPFTDRIEWMSVESAEMTKHAINAFLAVSVTYANEIAVLCEKVGADAKEVERGLKTEARIGHKAYLSPGGAFAGGTLARDLRFLTSIGNRQGQPTVLLSATIESNNQHKQWVREKLISVLGDLKGKSIAILGLTYKPGTNTLRRSSAVELCTWLCEQGARVQAFDPAIKELPANMAEKIKICDAPVEALLEADAIVVATQWPEFRSFASSMGTTKEHPIIIDQNRFLQGSLDLAKVNYYAVGSLERPVSHKESV